MTHKAEVLAFDREKRVYKDAYVDNFRRVRHFPALAAIGAGRSDGDSIILVQESLGETDAAATKSAARSRLDDVASRLMPTDPVRPYILLCQPEDRRLIQSGIQLAGGNVHDDSAIDLVPHSRDVQTHKRTEGKRCAGVYSIVR